MGDAAKTAKYWHMECDHTFLVYKDSEHVKDTKVTNKILGSIGEFCGAFYHTPETPSNSIHCLDKTCTIGEKRPRKQPKSVVALVRYEIEGYTPCVRRYSNCYTSKLHAEHYFKVDITEPREKSGNSTLIQAIKKGLVGNITMYITLQPCHYSTSGTRGTEKDCSCCDTLIELIETYKDINICIKPTHLCQAGWRQSGNEEKDKLIRYAEEGIKNLMSTGGRITLSPMTKDDWEYLWKFVDVPDDIKFVVGTERKMLDKKIGDMLKNFQSYQRKEEEKRKEEEGEEVDYDYDDDDSDEEGVQSKKVTRKMKTLNVKGREETGKK